MWKIQNLTWYKDIEIHDIGLNTCSPTYSGADTLCHGFVQNSLARLTREAARALDLGQGEARLRKAILQDIP